MINRLAAHSHQNGVPTKTVYRDLAAFRAIGLLIVKQNMDKPDYRKFEYGYRTGVQPLPTKDLRRYATGG